MRKIVSVLAGFALAILSASPGLAAQGAPLRVCFNDHDAPRADKGTMRGFDLDIMRLVAERLGRTFEPVWIASEPLMTEVDDSDLPLGDLAKGHCDAVASVPGDMALQDRHDTLTLTRAYYGAGFELVGPSSLPNDLAGLKGHKVSVQNVSVANLMAVRLGFDWTAQTTSGAQLAMLKSGKAEAALIWGPELGALGVAPKSGYTPPAVLRWNEHVATRLHDESLTGAIDSALAELMASGKVKALLVKYGVPAHAPFDKVFSPQDFAALRLGGK